MEYNFEYFSIMNAHVFVDSFIHSINTTRIFTKEREFDQMPDKTIQQMPVRVDSVSFHCDMHID